MCGSGKYPYTPRGRLFQKPKLEFPEGWGFKPKPSTGGV